MNTPTDPKGRYEGKPLLKLLDAYVLWAISALPVEQGEMLQQMTPKLREVWGRSEEHWYEVLASQMGFPASMPEMIRDIWMKNQKIAAESGEILAAVDFAQMFVDENFSG